MTLDPRLKAFVELEGELLASRTAWDDFPVNSRGQLPTVLSAISAIKESLAASPVPVDGVEEIADKLWRKMPQSAHWDDTAIWTAKKEIRAALAVMEKRR